MSMTHILRLDETSRALLSDTSATHIRGEELMELEDRESGRRLRHKQQRGGHRPASWLRRSTQPDDPRDDTIYIVLEKNPWTGCCLLIQGEEIKYAPDNRRLYVEDADGQKCKLDVLNQQKRTSP